MALSPSALVVTPATVKFHVREDIQLELGTISRATETAVSRVAASALPIVRDNADASRQPSHSAVA